MPEVWIGLRTVGLCLSSLRCEVSAFLLAEKLRRVSVVMPPTKESGGLTHEEFLGMWRAYLGLKAERDALRAALERYANEAPGWLKHIAVDALERHP